MILLAAFNVLLIIMRMYCVALTVFLTFQKVKNGVQENLDSREQLVCFQEYQKFFMLFKSYLLLIRYFNATKRLLILHFCVILLLIYGRRWCCEKL